MRLSEFEPASLTRQSFHERLKEKAIKFLERILTSLLNEREIGSVGRMDILRVLAQDSTQIWRNRKNSRHYRGVSNSSASARRREQNLILSWILLAVSSSTAAKQKPANKTALSA